MVVAAKSGEKLEIPDGRVLENKVIYVKCFLAFRWSLGCWALELKELIRLYRKGKKGKEKRGKKTLLCRLPLVKLDKQ